MTLTGQSIPITRRLNRVYSFQINILDVLHLATYFSFVTLIMSILNDSAF